MSDIDPKEAASIKKCREISKTIVDYGVNDFEIKQIIKNLSLELEDTVFMKKLNNIYSSDIIDEETTKQNKLIL
jgi:hypothetical protein